MLSRYWAEPWPSSGAALSLAGIAALWLAIPVAAQNYHLRHYVVDDGLPSSQVRDVTQDAGGRMWFATRSGVALYDGGDWRTFHVADGLSWADQFALRWDADGRLWSVSSNPPFRIYRFQTDRWFQEPGPGQLATGKRITSFELVPNDGETQLAIGTKQGLLFGGEASWKLFQEADGLPDDRISALAWWRERLLVATAGGLVELRHETILPTSGELAFALGRSAKGSSITGLAVDGENLWLLGTDWIGYFADGHLQEFDMDFRTAGHSSFSRFSTQPDRHGGLYFGDREALAHFHPELGFERLGTSNGMLCDGTRSLWLDREEILWSGCERGVTKIIDRRFGSFTRLHGLLADEVTAVFEPRAGTIVLGHRGGLSIVDPDGGVQGFPIEATTDVTDRVTGQPERVRDLTADDIGNLWIAADSLGLGRRGTEGRSTWWSPGEDPGGLRGAVTSVLTDSQGRLWIATDEGLFEKTADGFEDHSPETKPHVRRLFEGQPGEILLATSSGLHTYQNGEWDALICDGGACNSVFAILPANVPAARVSPTDETGHWVGTAAGLYRSDGERLVAVEEPKIDRPIFFMVSDHQQRIWFGTDNGVLRWDGDELRHFTVRDGLAGRETHRAAGFVDSRGDLWIGTERGVTRFSERLPTPRRAAPILELTSIDASGRILEPESNFTVQHDDNDLIFHFRATQLIDEERLQVEHRLGGYESEWRRLLSADDRLVRYTNLSPGKYQLHLRAAGPSGLWSQAVTSQTVTIAAPFWRQTWFFVVLAILFAALIYGAQRLLAQQRYSRRLETQVAERVKDLRASEERYRHVFERSQAVKLLLDADSLQILDANRAACRFYGYRDEDLKDLTLHDLRVPEKTGEVPVDTGSGTHLLAERHRSADGETHDVELYFSATETGGRSILYVIVQDVTDRRRAEETMSTERARLSVTLRYVDNGILTTDADGRILLANRKFEEISGWNARDAIGKRLGEVLRLHAESDDGRPGQRLHVPMTDDTLRPIRSALLVTASGDHRWVELSGSLIRRPTGEVSGLVLAIRDVTERRQIESELSKTQKLEAVGLLAGGIAHDFNNLLTVLLGNLSLLSRDLDPGSRQSRNLVNAEAAVLRARDLTHQLLTFSRGGTPIREAAPIGEVISESASFVLSGSKVSCEIDLPHDLWVVEIDAGQIHQVINNLLINAVQAMPDGGHIHIRGENLARSPRALPDGRYVAIHVADQGVGIPHENLEKIFDPYFSTKDEGRGLGLASAYSIVKQHEGLLTVSSEPGRGTTFSLFLPATDSEIADHETAMTMRTVKHGRILIMDDDNEVREVTGSMLERLGYRVAYAADGMQAIDRYSRALDDDQPFDAVIMDLTIRGGMGGKTAIQHLHDLDPSVKAIVVSGYSNDPVLAQFRNYGFQGRISKPFRTEDLARVLDDVLSN